MRKITLLLASLFVAMLCISTACSKHHEDEPSAGKYYSATDFVSTQWTGNDSNGNPVTLHVTTSKDMTCIYYLVKTLSKNTDNKEKVTDIIEDYQYDPEAATFTGKGKTSGFSYSGTITSKSKMTLTMPVGNNISMTKN